MKTEIIYAAALVVAVANSKAEELSQAELLALATREIYVAVVEFSIPGGLNPTKEKRLNIEYENWKAVFGLEAIKITDPIYVSAGIEFRDARFSSRESSMLVKEAWNRETELRVNLRAVMINENPSIVMFYYNNNMPRTPLVIGKIFGVGMRDQVEKILHHRAALELKTKTEAINLFKKMDRIDER
jgi:hypothetical protein